MLVWCSGFFKDDLKVLQPAEFSRENLIGGASAATLTTMADHQITSESRSMKIGWTTAPHWKDETAQGGVVVIRSFTTGGRLALELLLADDFLEEESLLQVQWRHLQEFSG